MDRAARASLVFIGLLWTPALPASGQVIDRVFYSSLEWRNIGPFRGGRTVGATGVAGQPNVFYVGVNNGGVWKSTDYGRVWTPIFDSQPTGSIGDVAVAQSNPDIIYFGSGEGLQRPDLTAQSVAAAHEVAATATRVLAAWGRFKNTDLTAINAKLKAAGLTPLEIRR